MPHTQPKSGVIEFILENSILLISGTIIALVWANLNYPVYEHFAHTIHFAVNDVGMVFFFALATKEVVEAMLPGGPLASPRQAAVPIFAAVGGMVVPAGLFLALASSFEPEVMRGWAVPCATDIAFSYLVARMIFRPGHPAIPFLLLLAIADDALGLIVLAVFYPSGPLAFGQLGHGWRRHWAWRGSFDASVYTASGSMCWGPACCHGLPCTRGACIRRWHWCPWCPSCPTPKPTWGCSPHPRGDVATH
jgi:hypothetical protein